MIKGLLFFVRFSWKHEKRYLIYRIFNQLTIAVIPILAIIMPRYLINELIVTGRIPYLLLYSGILVGYTFVAQALSSWLQWTGFTHRVKISHEFSKFLHQKTVQADYADIENSSYLELKENAEKFLFGDWRGFSYVLDMAIEMVGKIITLLAVVAVIFSFPP